MEPRQDVRKARFGALFIAAALLLVLVGLAASAGASDNPSVNLEVPGQEASGDDPERLFDGDHVVPVDLEAVEVEEAEREDWLKSPAAEHEREVSQGAYADLSPSASEDLLREAFSEQLETLNAEPARFLSDAQLIRPLDETAAAVKKDGEYSLMDAGIPVRAEDENGDPAKVELSLEPTPEGFEPVNGLVDLSLPSSADEAAEVGEEGVAISQAGADPSPARRFGDKNLFYGDVLADTDLLVAPTAKGVELFNLLRSEESPEDLRFSVNVPEGAVLRADEGGGAEVARDGETLTRIAKPVATDAQGTDVPVELAVEGDAVVLHVDHRGREFADPILVDPIVEDWANNPNSWYYGNRWDALSNGAWKPVSNNSQLKSWTCCWEGSHAGLMMSSEKNVFYGAKQFVQWSYSTANAKTYIKEAWITPFWRNDESCGSSSEPHDYVGMLWEPGEIFNPPVSVDKAKAGTFSLKGNGQAFIIGMGTGNGVWIGCNRYTYAGGVALWIDDDWPPVVTTPTITPSSGWINDTTPITIGANANDEGLGIFRATITPEGKAAISKLTGCNGLYGSRCPNSTSVTFNLTGDSFGEGVRAVSISAEDPSGKVGTGGYFKTKIDRTPPEVTLSGQLAKATNESGSTEQPAGVGDELSLPVYKLNIEATDGSNASDLTRRSGVKNIEIFLDGVKQSVSWTAQTATEDSMPMKKTYELKLSPLTTGGKHTLVVKVRDQVEKVREREIEFEYFPATGMKDEYVMQYFPLPDGSDESEEEHPARPELAVNVMNGNLVYREQDIDVNGAGADLEVERFYNSMLPTEDNTEWGDGWTLAETPELDPVSSSQAEVLDESGAIEGKVALPTEVGATKFDPVLQATIEKKAGGGYEMSDETGESATSVSFDPTGQAEALLTEGYAKVDYSYEGGELSEIEVEDPATFSAKPEIPKPQLVTAPSFGSSFGASGSGEGQLNSPADVAADPQGNFWVADKSNNRIEQFDEEGGFMKVAGGLGITGGKLSAPAGVAVDASGNVWVADTGNNRVEKFNEKGEFVFLFGKDVNKTKVTAGAPESERNLCTAASGNTCQAGVAGSALGQLKAPQGIAVTSSGNIWIADTGNSRLQKFSSTGGPLNTLSSYGSEPGKLKEPAAIAVAPDGSIWVADTVNNRVQQWSSSLALTRTFGTEGVGNYQFKRPAGIDVDANGDVWVADQKNARIQHFDSAAQFVGTLGTAGTGDGQFNFDSQIGISTDSKGDLWVAGAGNNRIQKWLLPLEKPTYLKSFGVLGNGDGQLKAPGDVALGVEGNLWVVDKENARVEKFDPKGKFLAKFGSLGSTDGKFNRPTSIAVDRDGNLLVVDSANNRIQKFDSSGQFIFKFGSTGTGDGQFATPEGVTADFQGNIWVADTHNGRLEKFDENGNFLKVVSSKGSGLGQLGEPTGLDVDPEGHIWVADWLNNRISAFGTDGSFLGSFGTAGSGPGQFSHPDEIEIDSHGNVWVGDQTNNRVERFNLSGEYVGQFGSSGTGEGKFGLAFPMGIATDRLGHLWVTDSTNNRIQQWRLGNYSLAAPNLDLSDGDPKVTVETPEGLVSKVSGNAAGTNTYTHVGDDLTAHKGPAGETKYEYGTSGRLLKVSLPNGTWATIAYYTDARVKSVTVDPAGSEPAKTTTFEYTEAPTRRTVVVPSDAPHVTYDIGEDGSVLKWWNALQPPVFDDLAGGLYENRNKEDGLLPGDQYLDIQAHSEEGIASIKVLTNDLVVHEATCEQTETSGIECKTVVSEWVSNTEAIPPGHLNIEVVITDRLGDSSSERFWVDIPEPPPPPAPGAPIPPKFADVLKFREEFGLEKVFPVANEIERNERIFNSINAWYEGEPVARASWERWGVPLRPADVAEMDYREGYVQANIPKIEAWAESHQAGTYAGYYLDHPSGGIMRVGFTQNQASTMESLKAEVALVAADRVAVYPAPPSTSQLSLRETLSVIESVWSTDPALDGVIVSAGISDRADVVEVTGINVPLIDSHLRAALGQQSPFTVTFEGAGQEYAGRNHKSGRIHAGDRVEGYDPDKEVMKDCTAGFGAWDRVGTKANGEPEIAPFLLTSGHCARPGEYWYRSDESGFAHPENWQKIGHVARTGLPRGGQHYETDGSAVKLNAGGLMPYYTVVNDQDLKPVEAAGPAKHGEILCFSGIKTIQRKCGEVIGVRVRDAPHNPGRQLFIITRFAGIAGDSGAPVWNPRTGTAVGLLSGGPGIPGVVQDWVTPLVLPRGQDPAKVPGILNAPGMGSLNLAVPGG